jgi:hypothetical protein
MKDLKFLKKMNTGDHRVLRVFGENEFLLYVSSHPDLPENTQRYADGRWDDFVAGRKAGGQKTRNDRIMLTYPGSWRPGSECILTYGIEAFPGEFKELVTTRPVFEYSDGGKAGPLKGHDAYSVGIGGLYTVWDLDHPYLVFGIRDKSEVGGEIDMPPSAFTIPEDVERPSCRSAFPTLRRETEKEIVRPKHARMGGVMVSDEWRNLTVFFDCRAQIGDVEKHFRLRKRDYVDKTPAFPGELILKRRGIFHGKGKYGELYMISLENLHEYVSENAGRFGGRAACLLRMLYLSGPESPFKELRHF